jgi:hypothetical protein
VFLVLVVALPLVTNGCASRRPSIRDEVPPPWVAQYTGQPIAVQAIDVSESDGYEAVFIKLSRIPDQINDTFLADPAEIQIDAVGPVGEDQLEQRVTTASSLAPAVRFSRTGGMMRIVVELATGTVPYYSVHQMADWLMVRLAPAPS